VVSYELDWSLHHYVWGVTSSRRGTTSTSHTSLVEEETLLKLPKSLRKKKRKI
jgi:hypothetical protein